MKKLIYFFIFLFLFIAFASYKNWIIITPKGNEAINKAKTLTIKAGKAIKKKLLEFYEDVRK